MIASPHPGPYWINKVPKGIQVCGRHGKVLYRFAPDQKALADAQVKALIDAAVKREDAERHRVERLRKAAPDLLSAAAKWLEYLDSPDVGSFDQEAQLQNALRAAVVKATQP